MHEMTAVLRIVVNGSRSEPPLYLIGSRKRGGRRGHGRRETAGLRAKGRKLFGRLVASALWAHGCGTVVRSPHEAFESRLAVRAVIFKNRHPVFLGCEGPANVAKSTIVTILDSIWLVPGLVVYKQDHQIANPFKGNRDR